VGGGREDREKEIHEMKKLKMKKGCIKALERQRLANRGFVRG